jgi:hypothetical protein
MSALARTADVVRPDRQIGKVSPSRSLSIPSLRANGSAPTDRANARPMTGSAPPPRRRISTGSNADTVADRLSARGRRDRVSISGRRQPPDELPRPSVVSLHCGGETCLAAAPLTFQRTTSKQRLRRAGTLDGLGKSHFHGWPKLPPKLPWGWSDDISAGNFSNLMTGFSPISAYRESRPSKKRSSPLGRIH